jgi:hypothetical protein
MSGRPLRAQGVKETKSLDDIDRTEPAAYSWIREATQVRVIAGLETG